MYYPEANALVPRTVDPLSKTPAFKCVIVNVEPMPMISADRSEKTLVGTKSSGNGNTTAEMEVVAIQPASAPRALAIRCACVERDRVVCHGCVSRAEHQTACHGCVSRVDRQYSLDPSRPMAPVHRKTKKTYNIPGHVHFLTFSCAGRLALLNRDRTRQWFIDSLNTAPVKCGFQLWAYVIMPEHAHLLIRPREAVYSIGRIEAGIKRPVSARAKAWLIETQRQDWLKRLTVKREAASVFRFWLPGGGYDENLWDERSLEEVIEYIHANPVRRGLVQTAVDWYWSSAAFWSGKKQVPIEMDPICF